MPVPPLPPKTIVDPLQPTVDAVAPEALVLFAEAKDPPPPPVAMIVEKIVFPPGFPFPPPPVPPEPNV
jgi:hypothetical protein